jgi:hypothetical protein
MRIRLFALAAVVAFVVGLPSPAHAAHHLWRLQQLFSNASGTIQFVELETTSGGRTGENVVGTQTLVSGGNTVQFSANLPANPVTQWILLATPNLANLPGGVAPDLVIPASFLATGGGTITYANPIVDTWSYGTVPTDGVHALTRDPDTQALGTAVNHPVNFSNVSGQVNLAAVAPALPGWAIIVAVGAMLLAGSGLLRRRPVEAV